MSRRGKFSFAATAPRVWTGRYRRVPGETTAIHVRMVDGSWWPVVEWTRGDEVASCHMVAGVGTAALAEAVNDGKQKLGAGPGGAFLIDEHGYVLVPSGSGKNAAVVVVGECSGPLRFDDPFSPGETLDLYDDTDLIPGELWDRPYVGLEHQLSRSSDLYFWEEDADGARKREPPAQDTALIEALRALRPWGPVRFLVGMGGVVITKVQVPSSLWEPRYVGRVDLETWFPKEVLA